MSHRKEKNLIRKQGGYAMLFTVIIVSAITVITAGLSNIVYKQLTLSSLAKDSQIATVWADTANECSIFFEQVVARRYLAEGDHSTWNCGGINFNIGGNWEDLTLEVYEGGTYSYELTPEQEQEEGLDPCFSFKVESSRLIPTDPKNVTITSSGYNICNKNKIRTVERSYKINYNYVYTPEQ